MDRSNQPESTSNHHYRYNCTFMRSIGHSLRWCQFANITEYYTAYGCQPSTQNNAKLGAHRHWIRSTLIRSIRLPYHHQHLARSELFGECCCGRGVVEGIGNNAPTMRSPSPLENGTIGCARKPRTIDGCGGGGGSRLFIRYGTVN